MHILSAILVGMKPLWMLGCFWNLIILQPDIEINSFVTCICIMHVFTKTEEKFSSSG
jgi:hypothetical protein